MIKAIFYQKDGITFGFSVTGHAGYDESGKDIVCAGVSALVINTINSLETFTDDNIISRIEEEGMTKVKIKGIVSPESELLLKSLKHLVSVRSMKSTETTTLLYFLGR